MESIKYGHFLIFKASELRSKCRWKDGNKVFFVRKRDNEKFNSPYLIIGFIYVVVGAQIILFYFGGTQIIFVFCFEVRKQISGHLVLLY